VGEVFGLLGPNGAGKTTTVEILEGYRRADAGEVRVLGVDPWRDGATLRPRIGVMLQEGGLYPGVRPLEALQLFASYYDDPDDPERLLQLVGLDDSRRTLVRRMSGGQQQRLSLALALVGKPSLVFLDEPTAGMDPHARATTWAMIRELRDRGVTVVLTTHAMDEAEHLCDRVGIIDRGRLVACDSPIELTARAAADEITFSTIAGLAVGELAARLGLAIGSIREVRPGDYLVDTAANPASIAALTAWLAEQGALVSELRAGRRSLEDVFLRLTGEGHS
jgi:ABC-2 type transport system ATP-binding protein